MAVSGVCPSRIATRSPATIPLSVSEFARRFDASRSSANVRRFAVPTSSSKIKASEFGLVAACRSTVSTAMLYRSGIRQWKPRRSSS